MKQNELIKKIHQTAAMHFSRKGFMGTSIRDVAKEIGIKNALIQYYAGTKEVLFWEIVRQETERENGYFSEVTLKAREEEDLTTAQGLKNYLYRVTSSYIESVLYKPDDLRIWAFSYLEHNAEYEALNYQYIYPIYESLWEAIEISRKAGVVKDSEAFLRMFVTSLVWIKHGYFFSNRRSGKDQFNVFSEENIKRFDSFYKRYIERVLDYEIHDPQKGDQES